MARKSLEQLFAEIDYSSIVERYLSGGYKVLDQYKQKYAQNNNLEDEDRIKIFLSKFLYKLQLYNDNRFYDYGETLVNSFYSLSLMFLEKKYPPFHNPPKFDPNPIRIKYDFVDRKNYSYKTIRFVNEVITMGVAGGMFRILEDLVILNAEDHGEI